MAARVIWDVGIHTKSVGFRVNASIKDELRQSLVRTISNSSCCFAKYKNRKILQKSERYLRQKVSGDDKRKRSWHFNFENVGDGGQMKFSHRKKGPSMGSQRRAHQLSVVMYEYITSMINSGEIDPRLPELGVDIFKVKMAVDTSALNVYWLATGSPKDDLLQNILKEAGYKIRTALTGLHLIGSVPPINFIKDVSAARLEEVTRLISMADMGPDHEPSELGEDLKSDIDLTDLSQSSSLQNSLDKIAEHFSHKDLSAEYGSGSEVREVIPNFPSSGDKDPVNRDAPEREICEGGQSEAADSRLNLTEMNHDNDTIPTGYKLRSDIYNVNHTTLTQRILQAKRRSQDRSFKVNDPVLPDVPSMPHLTRQDIQKLISERKGKERRQKSFIQRSNLDYGNDSGPLDDLPEGHDYDDSEDEDYLNEPDYNDSKE